MNRIVACLAVVSGLLLAAPSAHCADASGVAITKVNGGVQVGKAGAFKPATPGALNADEFLKVPSGATVSVKLANGQEATIGGQALVPCRRLMDPATTVDAVTRFAKVMEKAGELVGAEKSGIVPGAAKACQMGTVYSARLGKCVKKEMPFDGDIENVKLEVDRAETDADLGNLDSAKSRAEKVLANSVADKTEQRRMHTVLGRVDTSNLDLPGAQDQLDQAAAPVDSGEGDEASVYRAEALVARGRLHVLMGEDSAGKKDFQDAAKIAPTSLAASNAHYELGALALAANDPKTADTEFASVKDDKLQKAADNLKKTASSP